MDPGGFKDFQDNVFKALVETTRTSGQLANEDLAFHRSLDPSLNATLDRKNERLLALAKNLTKSASVGTSLSQPKLHDVESVDDEWKKIVDVLDNLLENADASLDEYSGVIKKPTQTQEENARQALRSSSNRASGRVHGQVVGKPQLLFAEQPANYNTEPFKPLLKSKPNAIVPLTESSNLIQGDDGSQQYQHPYEQEIKMYQTAPHISIRREPIPYRPLDTTTAIFIDTLEGVHEMLTELKQATEIAVDLEHHDEHSYLGIVSLMQISTREKDWVIDTLKPWRQDLEILNEIFTDPKILKVLQGSTMDIIWLQRDLGLYIVGMFDTYHASWALGYPKHGLAFLLKKFIDFDAAKQYQRADWRIRPLPQAMLDYARSDTHFLLYVYDMMRNELIDKSAASNRSLIEDVIQNSKQEALQRYERPVYDAVNGSGSMGWHNMLYKSPSLFNREQFAVFRAVHRWRDQVAREEDEGPFSILKNKALFDIARTLPVDMSSLLANCHPLSKFLQQRKHLLLSVIKEARASSDKEAEMKDFFRIIPASSRRQDGQAQNQSSSFHHSAPGSLGEHAKFRSTLKNTTPSSEFWGTALNNVRASKSKRSPEEIEKLHLILPLPPLDAEIFVDRSRSKLQEAGRNKVTDSSVNAKQSESVRNSANEIVVLRNSSSQKRKIGNESTSPTPWNEKPSQPNQNGIEINQDLGLEDSVKQLKKQERQKRKEAKRIARGDLAKHNGKESGVEQSPLDYENAPSVLHGQGNGDGSKASSKPLRPYNKSLNAPKGLGRAQKDTTGRSMTFHR